MKKKLLLISLSTGSGHVRAAEAIRKTAEKSFPNIEARHIDMADYISLPMKMAVLKSYDLLVKQLPELWGLLYKKTNRGSVSAQFQKLSAMMSRINASALYDEARSFQPDYILCTHFLPVQTLLQQKDGNSPKPALVMTDYDKHSFLTYPGVREYFVATERMKFKLLRGGITEEKLHVTGIPVDPVFLEKKDAASLKKKYGLKPSLPIILVLSGGQGLAKADDTVKALFESKESMQIVAVAGSNEKLKKDIERLSPPAHISLSVVGWTDAIDEYMRLADAVISKPGGMTTTECITLGKPLIAVQPIPGQEEQNAEYILEHGYGHIAHSTDDLLFYVGEELKQKKKPVKVSSGSSAAEQILQTICE